MQPDDGTKVSHPMIQGRFFINACLGELRDEWKTALVLLVPLNVHAVCPLWLGDESERRYGDGTVCVVKCRRVAATASNHHLHKSAATADNECGPITEDWWTFPTPTSCWSSSAQEHLRSTFITCESVYTWFISFPDWNCLVNASCFF